jgi:hypothetical protein
MKELHQVPNFILQIDKTMHGNKEVEVSAYISKTKDKLTVLVCRIISDVITTC